MRAENHKLFQSDRRILMIYLMEISSQDLIKLLIIEPTIAFVILLRKFHFFYPLKTNCGKFWLNFLT